MIAMLAWARASAEPAERLAEQRTALDLGCEDCHAAIADEWRTSLHARADSDPVYRAEPARVPAFCHRCHAPLANPDEPRAGRARGVGCVMCHAPHDGRTAGIATRRCATCHDFPFEADNHLAYAPGQRLQRTAREHAASPAARQGCASCHFPRVRAADGTSHVSHALPGARDPAMLAAALAIEATARAERTETRVTLVLRSRAGHAVPTGDLYRSLQVRALDAEDPEVDDAVALRRNFAPTRRGLREVSDNRVPADGSPRVVELHLPPGIGRVRWEITWLALSLRLAKQRGLARHDVRREVASGELAVTERSSTDAARRALDAVR